MSKINGLYNTVETLENRMARLYMAFHHRFRDRPELARFWSEAALEEMQHASILRYCREHGNCTSDSIAPDVFERIEILLETVASVAEKADLMVAEAFYASLLVEASELDEAFSKLTAGLLPDHVALYEAIQAGLRAHHERFAQAADRFLGDPAFVAAFRNLAKTCCG